MRIHCLFALFWCASAGAGSLASRPPANLAMSAFVSPLTYPVSLLRSVSNYLASQMEFSGNSSRTNESASGHLTMIGDDLILSSHDLALDFRDSVSRRSGGNSQSFRMHYAFPVAGANVSLAVEDSDYDSVVQNGDERFNARREYQALTLSGSRPLFSWQGLELDSLFSHSSGMNSTYQESKWVADSTHRVSRVGVRCSKLQALPGGFVAGSTLTALGGLESRGSVSADDSSSSALRYHKLALTASLNRVFYTWNIAVNGQYQIAPEDLASSEYLQIAGPSMMRGFNGQSKSVSEGGWFRVNAQSPGYSVPYTDALSSFLTFSLLRGWSAESDAGQESFRASTGEISLRLQGQGFHASMSVGRILDVSGSSMERPANPDVSLTLSMGI